MTDKQETGKATGLGQFVQSLVSGSVRYLPLLLLLSLLIPVASYASVLPANVYVQTSTSNPAFTLPTIPSACTANFLGGTCSGNDLITGTQTATANLYVIGNIIIPSGSTFTTNGYFIATTGGFNGIGAIQGGLVNNGAPSGPGAQDGASCPGSYGGSGGGGGNVGGNGGDTLASGGVNGAPGTNGGSPSQPSLTTNFLSGITNIQAITCGAGGGDVYVASGDHTAAGGSGSYGITIEANTISLSTANTMGGTGGTVGSPCSPNCGAGSGGGGNIWLIYTGSISPGTLSYGGGPVTGGSAGAGGAGGSGNAIIQKFSTIPIPIVTVQAIYPFSIYTTDTSNLYTLNSVIGANQAILEGPTNVLYYIPPANQVSGTYEYNITENNGISTSSFGVGVITSMNDIASPPTFTGQCTNVIQYFPNCAQAPGWNAEPTSWQIQSDVAGNNHTNTTGATNIDQFSNANKTFNLNLRLIYNQFSPAISFIANVMNNPVLQKTITQIPFNTITSNAVPASPTTREFLSLTTENEQTLAKLNTSTSVSFSGLFNNYTITNQTTFTGNAVFAAYIDNSLFQNPSFYISTLITSSTNASYFPSQNNFCPGFINSTVPLRNLYIYMVSYAVGQATTVDLQSNYGGANNGDYLQVLSGVNPTYATVVQQVLISTQNFLIPLIIGNSYSAIILSGGCRKVYQTPAAAQTNPWNINIAATLPPPTLVPQVNATCTVAYNATFAANTVTCSGYDNNNLVNQWNVSLYNSTGFLGLHLITSNVINGGTFFWQYYPVYTVWGPLTWRIVWNWGSVDPSGSGSGILQNVIVAGFNAPFDVFLTIIFLIVGILIGNATGGPTGGNTHKLSNTMFVEAFMIFLMYMIGITQWLGFPANASLIIFLIVVGMIGQRSEGGVNIGG